jgi:hypothetical protein
VCLSFGSSCFVSLFCLILLRFILFILFYFVSTFGFWFWPRFFLFFFSLFLWIVKDGSSLDITRPGLPAAAA